MNLQKELPTKIASAENETDRLISRLEEPSFNLRVCRRSVAEPISRLRVESGEMQAEALKRSIRPTSDRHNVPGHVWRVLVMILTLGILRPHA